MQQHSKKYDVDLFKLLSRAKTHNLPFVGKARPLDDRNKPYRLKAIFWKKKGIRPANVSRYIEELKIDFSQRLIEPLPVCLCTSRNITSNIRLIAITVFSFWDKVSTRYLATILENGWPKIDKTPPTELLKECIKLWHYINISTIFK